MPPKRPPSVESPTLDTPPKPAAAQAAAAPKNVRIDVAHDEFSSAVKKRLLASTRTGQACDRCKVRKIRCDGLPGGCSPCIQNNVECRTTDRITGRATSRGYVEGLEAQNRDLQNRIRELEQRLMHVGLDSKSTSSSAYEAGYESPPSASSGSYPSSAGGGLYAPDASVHKSLPTFRAQCVGDNYLGVATNSSHLSSIKGTALSILGMEIDIADFASPDIDEPDPTVFHPSLYNKSYQSLLQSIFNINPKHEKPDLPPREEGLTYADWYFRVLNPYNPILHKKAFMNLLTRMYDDASFRPSPAEHVMVHMVFAIMFFQYAVRNWEDLANQTHLNHRSNSHYHFALGFFDQLICSHTVHDIQALTMICAHLRNFPKPGASWFVSMLTMSMAMEMGLNRSVKRWHHAQTPSPLEVETRKRVFWALLTIHLTLSTKLGRPTALRLNDFDVEIPDPVDDEVLLPDNGIELCPPARCIHSVGLYAWRLQPLLMELYATIYAVRRRPENYIDTVNRLEAKWRAWKETFPEDLMKEDPERNEQETRIFSLWCEQFSIEFRILVRHPSVSMTTDPAFNAESMKICLEASRQLLGTVRQMQKFKSLDTTWYNAALYVMAITTTLFAHWDKRSETTTADLAALRHEMDAWLDIMGDVGALLGSGPKLREAVRVVTDGTLSMLSRAAQSHAASASAGNATHAPSASTASSSEYPPVPDRTTKSPPAPKPVVTATRTPEYSTHPPYNPSYPAETTVAHHPPHHPSYIPNDQINHPQTPYPAATQYAGYSASPTSSNGMAYPAQEQASFANFPPSSDAAEAPLLAAFAAQAAQVPTGHWPRPDSHGAHSGSQVWHQWTSAMAGSLEPQDCYSANALMSLGGRDLSGSEGVANLHSGLPVTSDGGMSTGMNHGVGASWPLNIFDINQTAGTQAS